MSDDDETRRASVRELIEQALDEIVLALDRMPPGARAREVRGKVINFRRALGQWDSNPPAAAQRAALRQLVFELREKTVEATSGDLSVPRADPEDPQGPPRTKGGS